MGSIEDDFYETQKKKQKKRGKYRIYKINDDVMKCYEEQIKGNIGIKFKEHLRSIINQEVKKSFIVKH